MKTEELATDFTLDDLDIEPDKTHAEVPRSVTEPPPPAGGKRLSMRESLSLSGLLRGFGALVIVAAFALFLFQGWRDGDELSRLLLLVGHTVVLTFAGFAAGHLLHEGKGARLFIALALAAIPVNFAFLGGLSYEHLTWDPLQTAQPSFGPWLSGSPREPLGPDVALSLTIGAVLLLGIAMWVGFLVLARRSAWRLGGLYLLTNAALLLPTRDTALISALLITLALGLAASVFRLRRRDPALATREGAFARCVLALPLLVVGGRSIWFYAPDALFFTTLALIGYVGFRQVLSQMGEGSPWKVAVEWAAVALAGVSALLALATVANLNSLEDAWRLPIAGALMVGLLFDLSRLGTARAGSYRTAGALTAAAVLLVNLFAFGGFANALVCLIGGIAILAYAYAAKRRSVFVAGLAAALTGTAFAGHGAFASFTISGWTGLVLLGIATILAGSIAERYGQRIKAAFGQWQRHFDATP